MDLTKSEGTALSERPPGRQGGTGRAVRPVLSSTGVARTSSVACGFAGCGAFVGILRFTGVVTVSPDWDLLDRLDAAAMDGANIHNDLCASFTDDETLPCSCGIPGLLADAAAWVREHAVETVVSQARRAV